MALVDYMNPKLIAFLNTKTRNETLLAMTQKIKEAGIIEDENLFYQALIDREKIVSTGIGMGLAIPHAKLHLYDKFFIAIGVLQKPVDWYSLDGTPVRLVFMIGGPDDRQTEYLQLLSQLTQLVKPEEKRKQLLLAENSQSIIELFRII